MQTALAARVPPDTHQEKEPLSHDSAHCTRIDSAARLRVRCEAERAGPQRAAGRSNGASTQGAGEATWRGAAGGAAEDRCPPRPPLSESSDPNPPLIGQGQAAPQAGSAEGPAAAEKRNDKATKATKAASSKAAAAAAGSAGASRIQVGKLCRAREQTASQRAARHLRIRPGGGPGRWWEVRRDLGEQ